MCVGLVHGTLCVVHGGVGLDVGASSVLVCTHVCPLSSHLFSLARQARARFRRVVLENLRVTRENNAQVVISRGYRAYLHRRGVNQEKLLYVAARPVLVCILGLLLSAFCPHIQEWKGVLLGDCLREGGRLCWWTWSQYAVSMWGEMVSGVHTP